MTGSVSQGSLRSGRLEPQITVGPLTDSAGFPLMIEAFEGNRAETHTMLPTFRAFMPAHKLKDVTIVADAGMVSEANRNAIRGREALLHHRREDARGDICGQRLA